MRLVFNSRNRKSIETMGKYYLLDSRDRETISDLKAELELALSNQEMTEEEVEATIAKGEDKGQNLLNHLLPYTAAIDSWHSSLYAFKIVLQRTEGIWDGIAHASVQGELIVEDGEGRPILNKDSWRFYCLIPRTAYESAARDLDIHGKAHKLIMEAIDQAAAVGAATIPKAAITAIKKELKLPAEYVFIGASHHKAIRELKGFVDYCRRELPRFKEWEERWEDYRRQKAGQFTEQTPPALFSHFKLCVESATNMVWALTPKDSGQLTFSWNTKGKAAAFVSVDYSKLAELNPKIKRLNSFDKAVYNTIITIWASQQKEGKKRLGDFFNGTAHTSYYQILEAMGLPHTKDYSDKLQDSIARMGNIILWAHGDGWTDSITGEAHPAVKANGLLLEIVMEETTNGRLLVQHAPVVYKFAFQFHDLVRQYPKEVMLALGEAGNRSERQWSIYFYLVEAILEMKKKNNPRSRIIKVSTLLKAIYGGRGFAAASQTQVIKAVNRILSTWKDKAIKGWLTDYKAEGKGELASWTISLPPEENDQPSLAITRATPSSS